MGLPSRMDAGKGKIYKQWIGVCTWGRGCRKAFPEDAGTSRFDQFESDLHAGLDQLQVVCVGCPHGGVITNRIVL